MKLSIFTHISAFLSGLSIGFALCFFAPHGISNIEVEQNTNSISVAISNSETNRTTTTHNVDWFKDNSNYIWDGWKIK